APRTARTAAPTRRTPPRCAGCNAAAGSPGAPASAASVPAPAPSPTLPASTPTLPIRTAHATSFQRITFLVSRFPFPVSRFPFPVPRLPLSRPRTPKPSPAPLARRQLRHLLELHHLHSLKHQLRDARAARHDHRLGAEVDHRNHQLPTIVRIDGRRGI